MSTNISKQKREELLEKINEIYTFISASPQDENTGKLLSYLSELEKEVNGKKYGLVFEKHREEIDEILDTHTPILMENNIIAEVKSTPDFREKENRRKPEITISFNLHTFFTK